jgi:hypothetical protein
MVLDQAKQFSVNAKIRFSCLQKLFGFGVSLCDITLYTQKQRIVMVAGLHGTGPNQTIFCKHANRLFVFTGILWFDVSLCDITPYTQKQHIVMVTGLHVTETLNQTISVNTKIGFSCLQILFGLMFHCATSPCTPKSNTLLWLQGYMLLKHQTQ